MIFYCTNIQLIEYVHLSEHLLPEKKKDQETGLFLMDFNALSNQIDMSDFHTSFIIFGDFKFDFPGIGSILYHLDFLV